MRGEQHTDADRDVSGRAKQEARADAYRDVDGRAKQDARADAYRDVDGRAKQDARAEPVYDRVILLLLFALFLLLSPIIDWWAADDSPWYAPYLIWGVLIVLTYALQRHIHRQTSTEPSRDD
jgi:hypothetical protein